MFNWFKKKQELVDLRYEVLVRDRQIRNLKETLANFTEAAIKDTQDQVVINWAALDAVSIDRKAISGHRPYTEVRYMGGDGLLRAFELNVSDKRHLELVKEFAQIVAVATNHGKV